jgi:carboxymethylenebutenolidase
MRRIAVWCSMLVAIAPLASAQQIDEDYVSRMEKEHATDTPIASPASQIDPALQVAAEDETYASVEGHEVVGYLAHPQAVSPRAGLVVIHEWWGLNDNIKAMTRRLAGAGYLALAVDLYQGEVAEDPTAASRLARGSSERSEQILDNLGQAIEHLRQAGAERIGVIGWCFGGGWSLRTALAFPDAIDATVIYYGRLPTETEELNTLASPVLGIFGALDEGIPVATVRLFQAALDRLDKEASIHIYDDADHAFANPSGTRYNEAAAEDAWLKTLAFFARYLEATNKPVD